MTAAAEHDPGRERDQRALMIALTALRDIAEAHGLHGSSLQKRARKILAEIEALSGDPFARIKP